MLKRQLDSIRKTKKGIEKRLVKGIKIFQKKKKTKSKKMVVNKMKNFLKKKNIKVVSMNVNAVKMKNKGQLNTKKNYIMQKK